MHIMLKITESIQNTNFIVALYLPAFIDDVHSVCSQCHKLKEQDQCQDLCSRPRPQTSTPMPRLLSSFKCQLLLFHIKALVLTVISIYLFIKLNSKAREYMYLRK